MRSAFRGPAHQLAVRMRINNCTHGHNNNIIMAQATSQPCMHHAPATARAPRVCTLVPFIINVMISTVCSNYHSSYSGCSSSEFIKFCNTKNYTDSTINASACTHIVNQGTRCMLQ